MIWEHARIYVSPSEQGAIDKMLTDMGADGWELVAVTERGDLYLKRPAAFQGERE